MGVLRITVNPQEYWDAEAVTDIEDPQAVPDIQDQQEFRVADQNYLTNKGCCQRVTEK